MDASAMHYGGAVKPVFTGTKPRSGRQNTSQATTASCKPSSFSAGKRVRGEDGQELLELSFETSGPYGNRLIQIDGVVSVSRNWQGVVTVRAIGNRWCPTSLRHEIKSALR